MNSYLRARVVLKRLADVGAGHAVDQRYRLASRLATAASIELQVGRLSHKDGAGFMALGGQRPRMLFELVHRSGREHGMRSRGGQALRNRQADSTARAGDQGGLAVQRKNVGHYY